VAALEAPVPLEIMAPASLSGIAPMDQPPFGARRRPTPAQEVALLEAGVSLAAVDPRVAAAAVLLARTTEVYIEDAPQIALLTVRVVLQLRAAKQAAAPMEVLVAATQWLGPGGRRGNYPRRYEEFTTLYRNVRLAGKDHAAALALIQPPGTPTSPLPGATAEPAR
jgi:hypothetical protein